MDAYTDHFDPEEVAAVKLIISDVLRSKRWVLRKDIEKLVVARVEKWSSEDESDNARLHECICLCLPRIWDQRKKIRACSTLVGYGPKERELIAIMRSQGLLG